MSKITDYRACAVRLVKVRKISVVLLICYVFLFAFHHHRAFACSGGAPLTVRGVLNQSDYLVKAIIAETDDLGQNAIIRVVSYLAGGPGPEYLLLERNNPTIVDYILAGRSSGGDCLGLYSEFALGDSFYAFVKRNMDGSYHIVGTLFNTGYLTFPTDESTVEIFLEGSPENENYGDQGSGRQVTEAGLSDIIAQETGADSVVPIPDAPYPLKAPLMVITDSDDSNRYLFPVDFGAPVLELEAGNDLSAHPLWNYGFWEAGSCVDEDCWLLSPDNLNIVVAVDSNTLRFTWGDQVAGQAAQFSSTSDAVAVWNGCELTIYSTGYPRLGQPWYELTETNQIILSAEGDCIPFHRAATWSPDGRLLAYSDADGLWLWDVFATTTPRLLIATEGDVNPQPRYFSPLGRYLAIAQGELYRKLDLLSGDFLPDGVISPDDRILLKYDTRASVFDLEICGLTPYRCHTTIRSMYYGDIDSFGEAHSIYELTQAQDVGWIDVHRLFVVACVPDQPRFCSFSQWKADFNGWYAEHLGQGYAFDYDHENDSYVFVTSGSIIHIDGREVDLSASVDGEIAALKWMPSLFYKR